MARAKRARGPGKKSRASYAIPFILAACCGIPALLILAGVLGFQASQGSQPLAIPQGQGGYGRADLRGLVVRTIDGEELDLGNTGGKPRILVAVATWCGTCAAALMSVKEAVKQLGGIEPSVVVIGIWGEGLVRELSRAYNLAGAPPPDTPGSLRSFVERFGDPSWKIVLDSDARILKALGLRYIDAIIVLNKDGIEVWRAEPGGYASMGDIVDAIKRASGA